MTFKLEEDEVKCLKAVDGNQLNGFLLITAAWNDQPQQLTHRLHVTFLFLQQIMHTAPCVSSSCSA